MTSYQYYQSKSLTCLHKCVPTKSLFNMEIDDDDDDVLAGIRLHCNCMSPRCSYTSTTDQRHVQSNDRTIGRVRVIRSNQV